MQNSEEFPSCFGKCGSGSSDGFQDIGSTSCGTHFLSLAPSLWVAHISLKVSLLSESISY